MTYDPEQLRDDHGRWSGDGGAASAPRVVSGGSRSVPVLASRDVKVLRQSSAAYPPAKPNESDTLKRFTRADGTLTPERQRLHDALERQPFEGKTPVANPTVLVMGGGPASGKSTLIEEQHLGLANAVHVDPDAMKAQLPEFKEGVAAGNLDASTRVHEESKAVAHDVADRALHKGYNVTIDGTGDGTYEKLAQKVAAYRAEGQRVIAHYATVDPDHAVQRSLARAARTGRHVPETYLRETHRNVSRVVSAAIAHGLFDEMTVWDTATRPARRIAYAQGRHLTVYHHDAWNRFQAKGR